MPKMNPVTSNTLKTCITMVSYRNLSKLCVDNLSNMAPSSHFGFLDVVCFFEYICPCCYGNIYSQLKMLRKPASQWFLRQTISKLCVDYFIQFGRLVAILDLKIVRVSFYIIYPKSIDSIYA